MASFVLNNRQAAITELQAAVKSSLSQMSTADVVSKQPVIPQIIEDVMNYENAVLDFALGDLGNKLLEFSGTLDFEHPDLADIFKNVNQSAVTELLELSKLCLERKYTTVLPHISKIASREFRESIRSIQNSLKNSHGIRLLKSKEDRIKARANIIGAKSIDLYSASNKTDASVWSTQPDNFKMYVRFDKSIEETIKNAERKIERYHKLKLECIENELSDSIRSLKSTSKESYCGFHRIKMKTAALVLAKVHSAIMYLTLLLNRLKNNWTV